MGSRTVLYRLVAAGFLASSLGALAAPNAASAGTADPILYATAHSDYKADCSYSGTLNWDRSTFHLGGSLRLENHLLFAACRKKLVIKLIDDEKVEVAKTEISVATACATLDWTCPSHINEDYDQQLRVSRYARAYVDDLIVEVQDRSK